MAEPKIIWLPHPDNTTWWQLGYHDSKLAAELKIQVTAGEELIQLIPRDLEITGQLVKKISRNDLDARKLAKESLRALAEGFVS